MNAVIRNEWRAGEDGWARAEVLSRSATPEGLDFVRLRGGGRPLPLAPGSAHILSLLSGAGRLHLKSEIVDIDAGVHLYLPPGAGARLEADEVELVRVSGPPDQARGARVVLRDERFVAACADDQGAWRWVLTPQYLSRRVFLHHDRTLTSRSGQPVSWFRTTMFDVAGLPPNDAGEPVFKMSYNHRTEPNLCYAVEGEARVRFARHPYGQGRWSRWRPLDGETTYHLAETPGTAETVDGRPQRNRHEVFIAPGGHVSLLCLFDPAPTGLERHQPGAYSEYGPLEIDTPEYRAHLEVFAELDAMVDALSWARARGELAGHPMTARYRAGRAAQRRHEAALLERAGPRAAVIAPWCSDQMPGIE